MHVAYSLKASIRAPLEVAHQRNYIQIDDLGDIHEFNEIDSTLAAFDVCNERLMPAEGSGDLGLR